MKRKNDTTLRDFVAFGLFVISTPWIFYFIGEVFA